MRAALGEINRRGEPPSHLSPDLPAATATLPAHFLGIRRDVALPCSGGLVFPFALGLRSGAARTGATIGNRTTSERRP